MPTKPRSHVAYPTPPGARCGPVATKRQSVTPQEIADVLDRLAACIRADGNVDLYSGWAVATLATGLGITVAMSSSDDPIESTREIGEEWADMAARQLNDEPRRRGDALRAAHSVVEQLLKVVQGHDKTLAAVRR